MRQSSTQTRQLRSSTGAARIGLSLAAALVLVSEPAAAARGPAEGTEILVTGTVTDNAGSPVEGVTLELVAARKAFSLRDFRVRERGSRTLRSTTDGTGSFEIRWLHHPYYNRFELVAGVEVGLPGGETALRPLDRRELTHRIRQGSPVVATFALADTGFVDAMRQLLADIDSEDERRVYREMGKPDKVRREQHLDRLETSWWYFDVGRVYRFHEGALDSVEEFEPIAPLPE
jgi:hypothetical protein